MRGPLAILFVGALIFTGCTSQRIFVTESDLSQPYLSLGALEVDVPTTPAYSPRIFTKLLTFGVWDLQPSARSIKSRIQEKLQSHAAKYEPDAVINVEYFPDPEARSPLATRRYFGKGEMVKYKKSYYLADEAQTVPTLSK